MVKNKKGERIRNNSENLTNYNMHRQSAKYWWMMNWCDDYQNIEL